MSSIVLLLSRTEEAVVFIHEDLCRITVVKGGVNSELRNAGGCDTPDPFPLVLVQFNNQASVCAPRGPTRDHSEQPGLASLFRGEAFYVIPSGIP